jgi:hypothetical protein
MSSVKPQAERQQQNYWDTDGRRKDCEEELPISQMGITYWTRILGSSEAGNQPEQNQSRSRKGRSWFIAGAVKGEPVSAKL